MKIKITIVLIVFGFLQNIKAQNAFYSAKIISKMEDTIDFSNNYRKVKASLTHKQQKDAEYLICFINDPFDNFIDTAIDINIINIVETACTGFDNSKIEKSNNTEIQKSIAQKYISENTTSNNNKTITTTNNASSSGFGIPQTAILNGLSKFMADRFKSEINKAFIERMKNELDSIPIIASLLPNTIDVLNLKTFMNYPTIGKTFVASLQKDLDESPDHLISLINNNSLKDYLEPDEKEALLGALTIYSDLKNGLSIFQVMQHQQEIIKNSDFQYSYKYSQLIFLSNLFSTNLIDKNNGETKWIGLDSLVEFKNNPKNIEYFLGLLYQANKKVFTEIGISKGDSMYATYFYECSISFETIGNSIENYKNKKGKEGISINDYITYINNINGLIQNIGKFWLPASKNSIANITKEINNSTNLIKDISLQDYGKATLEVFQLLKDAIARPTKENLITMVSISNNFSKTTSDRINAELTLPECENTLGASITKILKDSLCCSNIVSFQRKIYELEKPIKKKRKSKYYATLSNLYNIAETGSELDSAISYLTKLKFSTTFVTHLEEIAGHSYDDLDKYKKILEQENFYPVWLEKTFTYLSLAAEIVTAPDDDAIKKIINSVALPPGSYSIKRSSKFTFCLNGYAGASYNMPINNISINRFFFKGNENIIKTIPNKFAFSAPIGFDISWGAKNTNNLLGSFSIFITVIDIGAMVQYNLKSDSTINVGINFANVLAPGVSFIYGLKKWPVSVSAGIIVPPLLESVKYADVTYLSPIRYLAFNVGVLIDIPIYNFKNTPRDL